MPEVCFWKLGSWRGGLEEYLHKEAQETQGKLSFELQLSSAQSLCKKSTTKHHRSFTLTDGNQPLIQGEHQLQRAGREAGTFPWLCGEGNSCGYVTACQRARDLGGGGKEEVPDRSWDAQLGGTCPASPHP